MRAIVMALSLWAALPALSHAEPVRIVVGGIDKLIYMPVVLAQRLGYFAAEGLDVELQNDSSGVRSEDKLLSGAVQGVVGFYDHTLVLQTKGKFVRAVVQLGRSPGEAVVAPASRSGGIGSPADFAGRTLGVAGIGASTHLLMQYLGISAGVKPGQMSFVPIESAAAFRDGLARGRVDAGMATDPVISALLASGQARLVVDLRTPATAEPLLGGPYPGACVYLADVWIAGHRAQTQALVNAIVKALRYIDTHDADDVASKLPEAFFLGDRARYVEALRAGRSMYTADGRMPAQGPSTVLKVVQLASRSALGRTIDLGRTYTDDFAAAAP